MHFDLWPSTLDPSNLFLGDNGGTEMLFNVMKAYAVCDPEVGYCQGSAFLAGMLLLHMPEEDAFSVFMKLMSKGSGKIYLKSTTLPLVTQSVAGIQINILLSNILPISISILVFHLAAISILENWWQYIANILIEQYIANFEQYIAEVEQYIAHFMVDEKIF